MFDFHLETGISNILSTLFQLFILYFLIFAKKLKFDGRTITILPTTNTVEVLTFFLPMVTLLWQPA